MHTSNRIVNMIEKCINLYFIFVLLLCENQRTQFVDSIIETGESVCGIFCSISN